MSPRQAGSETKSSIRSRAVRVDRSRTGSATPLRPSSLSAEAHHGAAEAHGSRDARQLGLDGQRRAERPGALGQHQRRVATDVADLALDRHAVAGDAGRNVDDHPRAPASFIGHRVHLSCAQMIAQHEAVERPGSCRRSAENPRPARRPAGDRGLQRLELAAEVVVGSRHDDQLERWRQRREQRAQLVAGAELVALALHEQSRLPHLRERRRVAPAAQRVAECGHGAHARLARGHPQRHRGAEGEAAEHQRQAREAPLQLVERRAGVLLLPAAVVVPALAAPDPPEVEAQRGEARGLQRLGGAEHRLEVHHAPVQRVGVADDRGRHRRLRPAASAPPRAGPQGPRKSKLSLEPISRF